MTGSLLAWKVADGAQVAEGETVAVMEAMKMESQIAAPRAGRIEFAVAQGDHFASGTVIAKVA